MKAFKTWHRCLAVLALTALAGTPLFAQQQSAAQDETKPYLDKYAQLLTLLQEAKFDYVGYQTRSTPSEGLVARWEQRGTIRMSAASNAFHLTYAASRVHPDLEYLGTYEELVANNRYLDISILNYSDITKGGHVTAFPKRKFWVDTPQQVRNDEWVRRAADHELGILFGYAKLGCDEKSLLDLSQLAVRDRLPDQVVNSKTLGGYSAKTDAVEIRALFDPSKGNLLTELQISRGAEADKQIADFAVTRTSMSIVDVAFVDAKPSSIKVNITIESAGGTVEQPGRPKRVIEPQKWDYVFKLSNFEYEPMGDWFALDYDIPNGTPVEMKGVPHLPLYWKDGKLVPFPLQDYGASD
jgi:hypothetical protein